jgi:hypothetical protein
MWIDACENGSQTRAIFTRHPKRKLHEVHYAPSDSVQQHSGGTTVVLVVVEYALPDDRISVPAPAIEPFDGSGARRMCVPPGKA